MESQLAQLYRRFAEFEVREASPCYREWANGVASDPELLRRIDELAGLKRQPQLVFAAARSVGIGAGPFDGFRTQLLAHWDAVRDVVLARRTQTNEPARCAALLPVLAALPQPLALVEVGAAAGLCLYPDRYSYQFGNRPALDPATGPSKVRVNCAVNAAVPIPNQLPQVAWRAGIDLDPLDVMDDEDVRWLDLLIWPGQEHRRHRLSAAIEIARRDPPVIVHGDLNEGLEALARQAPPATTLVVFHSAVLTYLTARERQDFVRTVTSLPGYWLSLEGPSVAPLGGRRLPASPDPGRMLFVLECDGRPIGFADPQGSYLHWID